MEIEKDTLRMFARDSKRSMRDYKVRRFAQSKAFHTLVIMFLPFYMLFNWKKKSISIFASLALPTLAVVTA